MSAYVKNPLFPKKALGVKGLMTFDPKHICIMFLLLQGINTTYKPDSFALKQYEQCKKCVLKV